MGGGKRDRGPQLRRKAGRTGKKPLAEQTEETRTSGAFGLVKWVDKQSEAQRGQVSVPVLQCQWLARARTQVSDSPPARFCNRSATSLLRECGGELLLSWNPRAAGRLWNVVYFFRGACILCVPVFSASDEFVGLCTISRPWFPHLWNVFKIPLATVESALQPCCASFPLRLSRILCSLVWAFGWWPSVHLSPITF